MNGGAAPLMAVSGRGSNSYAPASQVAPSGRVIPRWSVVRVPHAAKSIAGLVSGMSSVGGCWVSSSAVASCGSARRAAARAEPALVVVLDVAALRSAVVVPNEQFAIGT